MTSSASSPELEQPARTPARRLAWLQVVAGGVGFVAAFILMMEKLAKLADPDYVPSCSINPIISCGSIMDSTQAALFGFPNPILGLIGFPVVIVSGVAALAGFVAPRWYSLSLLAFMTLSVVFVHWLIWVSLYEVGALCPYCMVVWLVTVTVWWYTLLDTVDLPRLRRFHSVVLAGWFVAVVVLVFFRFDYYWLSIV